MRLKVLLAPFLVVMILIISIGYIKPDVETLQIKRSDILSKENVLTDMDAVLSNIRSLNSSLDAAQDSEKFAYRYLPEAIDQDQIIDAFNFLASQSGLTIIAMDLKQPRAAVREEPVVDPSAAPFVTGANTGANPSLARTEQMKTFIFTGSVIGPYENIRAFFDRLGHMERFHEVRSLSIVVDPQATSPDGNADPNRLRGTFEATIGYFPKKPVASAFNIPVFKQSKLDLSGITTWVERITSVVPALERGEAGKPNPFQ